MNTSELDDQERWYAVRTKPKQEDRANSNLREGQVQTFTPKIKEFRPSGSGSKYVTKPLFTSYIFARFKAIRLHDVNYTRGVQNVVSFGSNPISIDDRIINLMKSQAAENGFICLDQEFKLGDEVRVNFGPLKDFIGIFDRNIKSTDRVKILLNTLNYQSSLLIDRNLVERVN